LFARDETARTQRDDCWIKALGPEAILTMLIVVGKKRDPADRVVLSDHTRLTTPALWLPRTRRDTRRPWRYWPFVKYANICISARRLSTGYSGARIYRPSASERAGDSAYRSWIVGLSSGLCKLGPANRTSRNADVDGSQKGKSSEEEIVCYRCDNRDSRRHTYRCVLRYQRSNVDRAI